ncbi:MAG: hypothetical protein ACR2MB_06315 [Acidimicrobiales bacterium]
MPDRDPDERVALPLDPEVALRALLAVDPDDENENGDGDDRTDQPR